MTIDERLRDPHTAPLSEVTNDTLRVGMTKALNLMDNINRGLFAKVIVATAGDGELTDPWEAWDVNLFNGTKVEVKASGTYQSWHQKKESVLRWDIEPHSAWIYSERGFEPDPVRMRRSDVYVFAIHNGLNPGETDEWTFRMVETEEIDRIVGDQKGITVQSLDRQFRPTKLTYDQLASLLLAKGRPMQ